MEKKKGDKDEKGSTYKVDLKKIEGLTIDKHLMISYNRLNDYKNSSEKLISEHNRIIKIRETAATIPDEYLRSVHLDNYLSVDDTRKLLICGCESEIKRLAGEVQKIKQEFNDLL